MAVLESITEVSSAIGGLGGAAGAGAAWRAALASRDTSRDALQALAVGIKPSLEARFSRGVERNASTGELFLYIDNPSPWAANELRLEVRYRDGRVDKANRERMNPNRPSYGEPSQPPWRVLLKDVKPRSGTDEYGDLREQVESMVLTYSDERDIARYELLFQTAPLRTTLAADDNSLVDLLIGDERRIR